MLTAASASRVWLPPLSASLWTATLSTPMSRQARMIRTAISPRLAMRTRRNGSPSVGPSLCKDASPIEPASRLQRDVAMLLSRVGVALGREGVEAGDEPRTCLRRPDHVVNVPASGGDVGIGESRLVLGDE